MLGRKAGTSLLKLPIYARLPLRTSRVQCQNDLTSRGLLVSSQRSYATPGRPRSTAGEPSKPVKRNVKREAKSAKTGAAGEAVKSKKTAAAKKKKKTVAKPKRKVLTQTQKEAAKTKLAQAQIKDLKKAALKPPQAGKKSAYNMFFAEKVKTIDRSSFQGTDRAAKMRSELAPIVAEWKSLSAAELEHYNHLANQSNEAATAEHERWVKSHTPEQIQVANRARSTLRRRLGEKVKGKHTYSPIKDERAVKGPVSAYVQFSINRNASGDFKNIPVSERGKLIGQEWKILSESEKKKYQDLQTQDINRYQTEFNSVFGHMPPTSNGGQRLAAAAA